MWSDGSGYNIDNGPHQVCNSVHVYVANTYLGTSCIMID